MPATDAGTAITAAAHPGGGEQEPADVVVGQAGLLGERLAAVVRRVAGGAVQTVKNSRSETEDLADGDERRLGRCRDPAETRGETGDEGRTARAIDATPKTAVAASRPSWASVKATTSAGVWPASSPSARP